MRSAFAAAGALLFGLTGNGFAQSSAPVLDSGVVSGLGARNIGSAIGITVGVTLALVVGLSRWGDRALDPLTSLHRDHRTDADLGVEAVADSERPGGVDQRSDQPLAGLHRRDVVGHRDRFGVVGDDTEMSGNR